MIIALHGERKTFQFDGQFSNKPPLQNAECPRQHAGGRLVNWDCQSWISLHANRNKSVAGEKETANKRKLFMSQNALRSRRLLLSTSILNYSVKHLF